NNQVNRYDGGTGAFMDTFVRPGSGGLNGATALAFMPTGGGALPTAPAPTQPPPAPAPAPPSSRASISFLPPVNYSKAGGSGSVPADLDGDGKVDLAVSGDSGVTILYGNGDG